MMLVGDIDECLGFTFYKYLVHSRRRTTAWGSTAVYVSVELAYIPFFILVFKLDILVSLAAKGPRPSNGHRHKHQFVCASNQLEARSRRYRKCFILLTCIRLRALQSIRRTLFDWFIAV